MGQGDAYFSSRRGHRLRSYSHATRSPARLLRLDAYPEDEFNPRPSSRRHLSTEFSSSEYDTDGVDDLDGVKSVVYSFKPARILHSEEVLEGNSDTLQDNVDTGASDSHSTETKKAQGDEQRAKFTKVDSTLDVSVSRYAGDAFLGGQHEAELTVVHDTKDQPKPLFRWMHMVQPILDFEDFLKKIEETGSLSQAELHALKRLFTQVKREAVKLRLTPEGKNVSHMDPKTLRVTIPADDSRPTPQRSRRVGSSERHITWVCIPYLSLETYTDSSLVQSETQFPIETMLQSKFARTSKAREKQQVLWQRNQSGGDECFHIAQLWCVIVDKSLLLTCGRMPSDDLMKGIITKTLKPPSKPSLQRGKRIYVSYYQAAVWSFSLERCSTWFGFTKSFHAFAPRPLRFSYRGEVITAKDWPRILNSAKYSSTAITLELRVGVFPSPPAPGILQRLDRGKSDNTVTTSTNTEVFHVFTWLNATHPGIQGGKDINGAALVQQLADIEAFLLKSTKVTEQSAYRRCNTATQQTVHAYLENQGKDIDNPENTTRKKLYSQRVDIYNAAELVCQFFLPGHVDEDAPTVGKFWGAIMSFVQPPALLLSACRYAKKGRSQMSEPSSSSKDEDRSWHRRDKSRRENVIPYCTRSSIRSTLRFYSGLMLYFQGIFNHIPAEERRSVRIDDALVQAWMHLLMGLIMGSQDTRGWSEHLETCSSRFQSGTKDIISYLSTVDLLEHAVLQPLELVSLLSLKLIQDSTDGKTDLTESYFQEVEDLDGEIREKPDRSHQSRINRIKEEIAIIKGVVQAQKRMVTRLQFRPPTRDRPYQTGVEAQILKVYTDRSTLERTGRTCRDLQQQRAPANRRGDEDDDVYHPYNDNDDDFDMGASLTESFKLSPTDPNGLLGLLLGDCQTYLERREGEFYKIKEASSDLMRMNANQIDSTKDRQEAAVYAFTMVTIVFLPLGTVSSIFGMNVSDIANLELSQWVFWATALPVTGLVIVTGLWWMGELRNLVDWLLGRRDGAGRGRSTRRHGDNSYYILSE
ncbi:hypothetical protein PG995_006728 [Apiospora arundinis]